jgi:hypothetical protein
LPPDPGAIFGSLLARCIRDEYADDDSKKVAEGVVFLMLGAFCSVLTTYLLSMAGLLL